ncbi:MAG: hypothetical protein IKO93_03045 [Lentisphaeria bacterium]|nr:hypothetical protein [Lentisphaeria bacterium]
MNPGKFPISSQEIAFITGFLSVTLHVLVSLLICKEPFDIERMLHCGIYSGTGKPVEQPPFTLKAIGRKLIGRGCSFSVDQVPLPMSGSFLMN